MLAATKPNPEIELAPFVPNIGPYLEPRFTGNWQFKLARFAGCELIIFSPAREEINGKYLITYLNFRSNEIESLEDAMALAPLFAKAVLKHMAEVVEQHSPVPG